MGHLERRALPAPVVGRGEGAADRVKNGYCKSLNFCVVRRNSRFTGDFALHESCAKVHPFAATFAMAGARL
jgi:hypothetical protein